MVKKQVIIIGLVVLMMVVGSLTAYAGRFGGHPPGPGRGFAKLINALDLSETQKTQVNDILAVHQDDMEAAHDSMDDFRQKIHDAMVKYPFDETAENELRLALKEASLVKEDIFVMRAKMMSELKAILTPEQQEKMTELHEERMAKMASRREHRKSRISAWLEGQGK